MFSYGKTPLNPVLESADETPSDWRRESVSIDSAYGERFTIHLDLPARASPPYQAVVYFPGANALEQKTFEDAYWERFDYIPRSGRVLVRPIMAGMYERSLNVPSGRVMTPQVRLERGIKWVQDLGRTLDYLESRGRHRCGTCRLHGAESGPGRGPGHARVRASIQIRGAHRWRHGRVHALDAQPYGVAHHRSRIAARRSLRLHLSRRDQPGAVHGSPDVDFQQARSSSQ